VAWHGAQGRSAHGQGSHRLTECKDAALPQSKIQKHAPQSAQTHLFLSTDNCFDRVQQESSFPACTTHSTAFFTPLRAIRSWKPYKRPSQTTWTLARKKEHMGDIAQGFQTRSYQERTAQRPVSFSRSRFTCTPSQYQVLPQRALASEETCPHRFRRIDRTDLVAESRDVPRCHRSHPGRRRSACREVGLHVRHDETAAFMADAAPGKL